MWISVNKLIVSKLKQRVVATISGVTHTSYLTYIYPFKRCVQRSLLRLILILFIYTQGKPVDFKIYTDAEKFVVR